MASITAITIVSEDESLRIIAAEQIKARGMSDITEATVQSIEQNLSRASADADTPQDFRQNLTPVTAQYRAIHGHDQAEAASEATLRGQSQKEQQEKDRETLMFNHPDLYRLIDKVKRALRLSHHTTT